MLLIIFLKSALLAVLSVFSCILTLSIFEFLITKYIIKKEER